MAKQRSREDRAALVARALGGGVSKRQVAEEAGVSEATLYRWIKEPDLQDNVSHLRVVHAEEEPPVSSRRKSVTEAADDGSTRDLLVATRTRIAKAVEDPNTPARDLASLTKRLFEVVRDIEAIDARGEEPDVGDVSDEGFDSSAI